MKHLLFFILVLPFSVFTQDCSSIELAAKALKTKYSKTDKVFVKRQLDSLMKTVSPSCTVSLMHLYSVAGRLKKDKGETEKARLDYNKAIQIANDIGDVMNQKNLYNLIAASYDPEGRHEKAIPIVQAALKIKCHSDSIPCIKQDVKLRLNLAAHYRSVGSFQRAIQTLDDASQKINSLNIPDSLYKVVINNSKALIYEQQLEDFPSTLKHYKLALNYCPKDHPFKHTLQNNIGFAYSQLNNLDSAEFYYKLTLESTNNPAYLYSPYAGLGHIESEEENYSQALKNYETAYNYAVKSKQAISIYRAAGMKGITLYKLDQYELSLMSLSEAIDLFESRGSVATEKTYVDLKKYKLLCEIALQNKELHGSLLTHLNQVDSLNNEERISIIDSSMARLETRIIQDSLKLKQAEIDQNKLQLRSRNYGLLALFFGFLASALGIISLRKRLKIESKNKEQLVFEKSELENLNLSLRKKLEQRQNNPIVNKLEFKTNGKIILVEANNILYSKAENNGSRIFSKDRDFWTEIRFKDLIDLHPETMFSQVFRSTIVNIDHVDYISTNDLKMKSGEEFKISRTYKKNILERLSK